MFGLETDIFILLFVSLLAACAFEFVNGFHDTANAVATVIYTNALKPTIAVVLSGIFNFIGVLLGGIGVAMGIVNLLPIELLVDQNVYHSLAMVFALLLSAIIWNVGTWYFGLPSSSSHTLIGSILGVGLAFSTLGVSDGGVNWEKAIETGYALLLSPLLGFSLVIVLMFLIRRVVPEENKVQLFKEPKKNTPPPTWIRTILIATCSMVSFVHGSNDGQKGVGLVMLILIGVVPFQFAIKPGLDPVLMQGNIVGIEQTINALNPSQLSGTNRDRLTRVRTELTELKKLVATPTADKEIPKEKRLDVRRDLLLINSNMNKIAEDEGANLSSKQMDVLKASLSEKDGLRRFTDYAPLWVILMIAVSLGLGTMIGWRRIVVTVGEKIGKQHLTYAQGASAELTAAVMIGLASWMKLPVSTTHVLSSGIAGSMVASKGIKNLQASTVRNIALAWVLTLPVSVLLSFTLFLFFRWLF
ncbi:MAG: inorganic phosphate transporter [Spirosoma sp.]|nr:inorganic phosphate transporter [Spirosoma sp.]